MAVAEKVDEHGQRSAHCVEGYYLFAKAIIEMLESTQTANRSDSASIRRKMGQDKLRRIPIWSSSSSGSDSAASDEVDEGDDDDEMEGKDAAATASPDHTAVEKEVDGGNATPQSFDDGKDSDSESSPELVAWRLLRRSEEILTSQAASAPQQQNLLHRTGPLSRVQALLRWFAPHEQGANTSTAQAAVAAVTAGDSVVNPKS